MYTTNNMASRPALLFFFIALFITNVFSQSAVVNVNDSGAKGDGKTDNAKAFQDAWAKACGATTKSKLVIPTGQYLTGAVKFEGPCKNAVEVQVDGTVLAPPELSDVDDWITFNRITGLSVSGAGTFDGQGKVAWSQNKCSQTGGKCKFPNNLTFNFITDGTVTGITSLNSKKVHMHFFASKNIKLQGVKVIAPGDSLNTDGIHLGITDGVQILGSQIGTGDDCIAIINGTTNVLVEDVTCGPGHGISIGSMGGKNPGNKEEFVTGVTVRKCTFTGTDNGIRIKTWPDGVGGRAENFTFEDLTMKDVKNPIVIDQEYCPYNKCNKQVPSKIAIKGVRIRNITGTSATKEAVILNCSKGLPCQGVELSDIKLEFTGGAATAICNNLKPVISKNVFPTACSGGATSQL